MHAVPFVATIIVALAISTYLLLDPSPAVTDLMQLTYTSMKFRIFLIILGVSGFACAYGLEKYLFPVLAKVIGLAKLRLSGGVKRKRKAYKLVMEKMDL